MAGRGSTTSARALEMRGVLERSERSGRTLKEFGRREGIAAPLGAIEPRTELEAAVRSVS